MGARQSELIVLGERIVVVAADDQMIMHVHVDVLAGRFQSFGNIEIVLAGNQVPGGMIVHEDHRRRVSLKDHLDHLPGVNGTGGQCAFEKGYQVDYLMNMKSQFYTNTFGRRGISRREEHHSYLARPHFNLTPRCVNNRKEP